MIEQHRGLSLSAALSAKISRRGLFGLAAGTLGTILVDKLPFSDIQPTLRGGGSAALVYRSTDQPVGEAGALSTIQPGSEQAAASGLQELYPTPNGEKTVSAMLAELIPVGYDGPKDTASVLTTYRATTGAHLRSLESQNPERVFPDLVSAERLASCNIFIHNSSSVTLRVREAAFTKDPLFIIARQSADKYESDGPPPFAADIFLIDTARVTRESIELIPPELQQKFRRLWNAHFDNSKYPTLAGICMYSYGLAKSYLRDRQSGQVFTGSAARTISYLIVIATQGEGAPSSDKSTINPLRLGVGSMEDRLNYQLQSSLGMEYLLRGELSAGFTLRHETRHLQNRLEFNHDELAVDIAAMRDIWEAYQQYITTGDNSGYYFVFSSPAGMMLARKFGSQAA